MSYTEFPAPKCSHGYLLGQCPFNGCGHQAQVCPGCGALIGESHRDGCQFIGTVRG